MRKFDRDNVLFAFTTSATTAVTSSALGNNGSLVAIMFDMPSFSSASASGTLSLLDPDSNTIWASTTSIYKQGTSTWVPMSNIPLVGSETLYLVISAIPSGAATTISITATAHCYTDESG